MGASKKLFQSSISELNNNVKPPEPTEEQDFKSGGGTKLGQGWCEAASCPEWRTRSISDSLLEFSQTLSRLPPDKVEGKKEAGDTSSGAKVEVDTKKSEEVRRNASSGDKAETEQRKSEDMRKRIRRNSMRMEEAMSAGLSNADMHMPPP